MSSRLVVLLALLCVAAVVSPAYAAAETTPSPWWQVRTRSIPTNQWVPEDFEEEITTENGEEFGFVGVLQGILVDGEVVGCLATAGEIGSFCPLFTGFPPTSTAAELETLLEGVYGTSAVEVSGGPVGGVPFKIVRLGGSLPKGEITGDNNNFHLGHFTGNVRNEGGSGHLVTTITNLGDAQLDATQTPLTIVDELPEGVEATKIFVSAGREATGAPDDPENSVSCSIEAAGLVACSLEGTLQPYEAIELDMWTSLTGQPPAAGAPGKVTVSGGNAPAITAPQTVNVSPEKAPFGLEYFTAEVEAEGGGQDAQAGDHPFQFTTSLALNSDGIRAPRAGATGHSSIYVEQPAMPRSLRFPLPVGLIANATARPQCPMTEFLAAAGGVAPCSPETALGVAAASFFEPGFLGLARREVPVFNLPPARGEPARFGFVAENAVVVIDTAIDPSNGYRGVAEVSNLTQLAVFLSSTVTLWGNPGDPRHDASRGNDCLRDSPKCQRPSGLSEVPFLRMPVSCGAPLDFLAEAEPWNVPIGSVIDRSLFQSEALHGCNRIPFDPTISATPTSKLAANPSGLDFDLTMPNSGLLNPDGIAEGQAKKIEVALPEGVTINPSEGEGLVGCSPAQYAAETASSPPGAGCPEASKVGSVQIQTPLLEEEAKGSLYVASPHDNPFDSLVGLYLVAKIPERGIVVKQAGKVEADPKTGQLTTTFDDVPQLPFNSFHLHFREGGRAPLVTPPACGTYDIVARFVPWSAADPDNPRPDEIVTRTASFEVERGVDGGACPSGGLPPFHPNLSAGTINNAAGRYSPFNLRLTRTDGEQEFTHFSIKLPPGVSGKLAGIPLCSDGAIAAAKARTGRNGGAEELEHPSCPGASQVGRTLVGAGVGSILTYVPGKLYLAGPYNGAPISVVSITAAKVGPFDLGTVVVREGLKVNPETAEVFVDAAGSDPIPHIIQGIPVHARDIRIYTDRPEFTLNPTSCEPTSTASTVVGSGLDFGSAADDVPVTVTSRFQAADCQSLGFKPRLAISLLGGTKRGDTPRLKAVLRPRAGDANIAAAQVTLPHSVFLEQAHIRTVCTRVQFNAGAGNGAECPKASVYGQARAISPLLDEPLTGPVYLRSSSHPLPDLVAALHAQKIDFNLVGRIDSGKGGRIRNTFEATPDVPVTKFVLQMQGGKKGLVTNSTNLCAGRKHRAIAAFTGHNGKQRTLHPVVGAKCGGKKASSKRHSGA